MVQLNIINAGMCATCILRLTEKPNIFMLMFVMFCHKHYRKHFEYVLKKKPTRQLLVRAEQQQRFFKVRFN